MCYEEKEKCVYNIAHARIHTLKACNNYLLHLFAVIEIEFNFAIVISGFNSLCAPHAIYYDEEIDIPSLHIYGENDQVIPIGIRSQSIINIIYIK